MEILPVAVFALLLTNICYAGEKPIPTSKEELAEWIIGTEWVTYENRNSDTARSVRKFLKDGVMLLQDNSSKWDHTKPFRKFGYEITSQSSFQFGPDRWAVEFSDDFKKFKGHGRGKRYRITGKLID